jgi:hypothetical protein
METMVKLQPARYVTLELAETLTGYTVKAMERKKALGVWRDGFEYVVAPDGRILIDIEGYNKWAVSGKKRASRSGKRASESASPSTVSPSKKLCEMNVATP